MEGRMRREQIEGRLLRADRGGLNSLSAFALRRKEGTEKFVSSDAFVFLGKFVNAFQVFTWVVAVYRDGGGSSRYTATSKFIYLRRWAL